MQECDDVDVGDGDGDDTEDQGWKEGGCVRREGLQCNLQRRKRRRSKR